MANIDVVRKRSNTLWFWVIALIIVALLVLGFFLLRGAPDSATTPVTELLGPALTEAPAALA